MKSGLASNPLWAEKEKTFKLEHTVTDYHLEGRIKLGIKMVKLNLVAKEPVQSVFLEIF